MGVVLGILRLIGSLLYPLAYQPLVLPNHVPCQNRLSFDSYLMSIFAIPWDIIRLFISLLIFIFSFFNRSSFHFSNILI